jgi:hypothetical protein
MIILIGISTLNTPKGCILNFWDKQVKHLGDDLNIFWMFSIAPVEVKVQTPHCTIHNKNVKEAKVASRVTWIFKFLHLNFHVIIK